MDRNKAAGKNKSFFSFAKSAYTFVALSLFTAFFWGCQSSQKNGSIKWPPHPKPPKGYIPAEFQQITFEGHSRYPSISRAGRQMVYVSSQQTKHSHPQIYIMDFANKTSRRITFQDGANSSPTYSHNDKKLIYSSSTDEIKERPTLIYGKSKVTAISELLPVEDPAELYISYTNGSHIHRLTRSINFDGTPSTHPEQSLIYFSSQRTGNFELYRMDDFGKKLKQLTKHSQKNSLYPQLSPSGKYLAWIEFDANLLHSKLVVGNSNADSAKALTDGIYYVLNPNWHPSENFILFSSNLASYDNFELYVYDLKLKCIKRLSYLSSKELDPTFSPDGVSVYFSSNLSGDFQIYQMPFLPPETCSLSAAAVM